MRIQKLAAYEYLLAGAYLVVTSIVKWRLSPDLWILFYFAGGMIGLHLLDLLEQFLSKQPSMSAVPLRTHSPLRSSFVQLLLVPITFFVITSTNSLIGAGMVLMLNFHFLYLQHEERQQGGNLTLWLRNIFDPVDARTVNWYLYGMTGIFLAESIIFMLIVWTR
ncbi:TPA: hypothetical protein DIV55_02825 [Patescibacteria group bacterium]|uniref:Uncharacterized protein n=1 Tax=Candidatus Gottesmanbacteria bacterium GW2011_GWA1_43_11 TaxID=1618436 RepID=A0A0G1CHE1_9BACT|nr:MAG: hypothetical protein UV59_C0012G0030 [Candidatus Gottesmanbacteria bacterium GW2011_GWA1_43_11]HCS78654.1 hypothetical protein [Patescibacteria group bacterium]